VIVDALTQTGPAGPPLDHQQRFVAVKPGGGQLPPAVQRAKQRRPFLVGDAGRRQLGVQVLLGLMVRRFRVFLAALLVQGNPAAQRIDG